MFVSVEHSVATRAGISSGAAQSTYCPIAILIKTEVMSPQLQNSTDVEVLTNS